ncbi:hypothetical protein DENIS_4484 [Desulfonema ishimotonii]|uniref:Uncharacterized protein n=1 Tax=Desulfonema ishimotonii TaxID=45657 RepID=A0A401G2N0_9BACT|nr:recombinase family protein [Desulfonema ishimotonii]GBC63490.1 hypothetical protein DENIS_4484 [Desulfonema ishimotonii]
MNDFLKSLRSNSKDRRYDRNNRKPYGNSYPNGNSQHYNNNPQYRGNDKGNGNVRKNTLTTSEEREKLALLLGEALPEIKGLVENIAGNQQQLIALEERKAIAEERKADAIDRLADAAIRFLESAETPFGAESEPAGSVRPELRVVSRNEPVAPIPPHVGIRRTGRNERDAVLNVIYAMRDEGATYTQIASYLEEKSVPTFSGKGKWHAQTIHRVCQIKN